MSNNDKRDNKLFNAPIVSIKSPSGSVEQKPSDLEVPVVKRVNKLLIPIEKYIGYMSPEQLKTFKEHQRAMYPDLFKVKGITDDKASEIPFLALTMPIRLYTDLLEVSITEIEKEAMEKITH